MSLISKVLRRIWAWYVVIMFGLLLVLLYPFFWILLRDKRNYLLVNHLRIFWANLTMFFAFTWYRIDFTQKLDPNKQYVICPNHSSMIDILLAALVLRGRNYKFMGKKQLLKVPLFNLFFKTIDIPVDRESKMGSFRAYKAGLQALEEGYDLIIFPEGTTSNDAPEMLPFKSGPFKIAIDKQIPLVPVTFLDNWHRFLFDGSMLCNPGLVRAIVHAPIDTKGMTADDEERLKTLTFNTIDSTLRKEYEGRFAVSG